MTAVANTSPMTEVELNDLLIGSAIYGCGGGGTLEEGRYYLNLTLELGAPPLIRPSSLPGSTLVAMPFRIGSAQAPPEANSPSVLAALRHALSLGIEPAAVAADELGAINPLIAAYCAAVLRVPLLDADQTGCAVPEVQQCMLPMLGIVPDRVIAATAMGRKIVLEDPGSDEFIEAVLRVAAEKSGNAMGVLGRVQPLHVIQKGLYYGSLRRSMEIGAKWRNARNKGLDVAQAVSEEAGGTVLFRGTMAAVKNSEEGGFSVCEVMISGEDGKVMRVTAKNENMAAYIDDQVVASIPEVISLFEQGDGKLLLNPIKESGQKVVVLALPAAEGFQTKLGLSVFGPKYAGLDGPFRSAISPKIK